MAAKKKYVVSRFEGDDSYSWAVFYAKDVFGFRAGSVIFSNQAKPIVSGESRKQALSIARRLELKREDCKWYLNCTNKATTEQEHPVLGKVPICERCLRLYNDMERKIARARV